MSGAGAGEQAGEDGLRAREWEPLPLSAVMPAGWLRNQLQIQADGLSGHLDEFWPDVADSKWIGGQAEGWERGPYWLDGIVPLAILLDDERLKAKARFWVDSILARQHEDGWLGAKQDTHVGSGEHKLDPWPQFVVFKALAQWHEATGDPRILPAMTRALHRIDALLDETPLQSWAKMRWPDLVVSIHWLMERTTDAEERERLLALARKAESQGYDWRGHFADFQYTGWQTQWILENHVVNHAMALKEAAVRFRHLEEKQTTGDTGNTGEKQGLKGDEQGIKQITNNTAEVEKRYAESAVSQIAVLDRYHGQATGVFTGDESLAGLSPSQGTELCAVVETLYSLEHLLAAFGDKVAAGGAGALSFADRWERIAYNALPATFKPDMWAHQYVQQANQVVCKISEERVYTNNSADANLYGLEPCFGCCTANMHQGWPKFAAHLWMSGPNNALVALGYAPCRVQQTIGGVPVAVEVATNYPFEEAIAIVVRIGAADTAGSGSASVRFPLRLRIPGWCANAQIQVGEEAIINAAPDNGFVEIERDWTGETMVRLTLPMTARVLPRPNNAISIERGPLVYALAIAEEWKQVKGERPHADWEVHPVSGWNYALRLDSAQPISALSFSFVGVGAMPFSPEGSPVRAEVPAVRMDSWTLEKNAAAPPSGSSVCPGPETATEFVTLLPYGCTNLRVTEFPVCPPDALRDDKLTQS